VLPLSEWQTFFSVQAETAATLTGLVFVAVSINLARILTSPGLPGRAAETIAQFLQVFFISTAVLIPGQESRPLAAEILGLTLLCWALQVGVQAKYATHRAGHPTLWIASRIVQTQLCSIPLFLAGFLLLTGSSAAIYWLIPGFFLSFLAGVINAWVLLVEINR
jgi:hypothetical protein